MFWDVNVKLQFLDFAFKDRRLSKANVQHFPFILGLVHILYGILLYAFSGLQ